MSFGSAGSANGEFSSPLGVAVNSIGRILVADTDNSRIQKFDTTGEHIQSFGGQGSVNGQFIQPSGITVNSADKIIVADTSNHRIQIFDSAGNHLQSFGSEGFSNGQFSNPTGIATDSTNRIIVADTSNHRIQIFDSTGNHIQSFGSFGTTDGLFRNPSGIAINSAGQILVADTENNRIQIFDSAGNHLQSFGSVGAANGQFFEPLGIEVDSADRILVVDSSNHRIQIFDSTGNHLQSFGSVGPFSGQFINPSGIAIDSADRILVADTSNHRIQIFRGSPLLPESYWKAENNVIDSTATNAGTMMGATFAPSQFGTAFSFNGVNGFVSTPFNSSLDPDLFTISLWVKLTGGAGTERTLISTNPNPDIGQMLTASATDHFSPQVNTSVSGNVFFDGSTSILLDEWYHVAMTHDGAELKLYVNGLLDGTAIATGNVIATFSTTVIGAGGNGDVQITSGLIDEVKIFDIVLDSQLICKETKTLTSIDSDSDGLPDSCDPSPFSQSACPFLPVSGDWIITSTCSLENDFTSPANIIVQDGVILTIPNGITLSVPSQSNVTILSGGGILIEFGGTLIAFS